MSLFDASHMLLLFEVLLLCCGIYTGYTGLQMKKTKKPAKWLLEEETASQYKDPQAFALFMTKPSFYFGAELFVCGILGIGNRLVLQKEWLDWLVMAVLLLCCIAFFRKIRKAKEANA